MDLVGKVDGVTYMLPFYNYAMGLLYRKDLLADDKNKADFKAANGFDLEPPKTWDEYLKQVAFFTKDAKQMTKFYCDVLGFRVSDWMGDFFSFLRCGPDHHTINLMTAEEDRHFHTAFELRDWAHLQTACDYLSLNGYKMLWGPGRHGIGHNLFAYHRAPNGLITELFAELDKMNEELGYFEPRPWHRDRPQRPKVWTPDPSAQSVGPGPSDEMRK
jgi:catechol 2,3-dioxygenase-like lactoylglutathione lyase family enzyme